MLQELFCGMLLSIIDFLIVFEYVDLNIFLIIHIELFTLLLFGVFYLFL